MSNKVICSLGISLVRLVKAISQIIELSTSVMITGTISSHEPNSLAISRPLNVSAHCCLVFVHSKRLVFVTVASAMTDSHRSHLALASNHQ